MNSIRHYRLSRTALTASIALALFVPLFGSASEETAKDEGSALFGKLDVAETLASNGLVTGTTGASAQEAGVRMLKAGGTAADAIVAKAMNQICLASGSWVSYEDR